MLAVVHTPKMVLRCAQGDTRPLAGFGGNKNAAQYMCGVFCFLRLLASRSRRAAGEEGVLFASQLVTELLGV